MKIFLNFVLILTLACLSQANPVKWGKGVGSKLLYRINVVRTPIQGFAQDVYVAYPKDGEPAANEEIVDIWVYNRDSTVTVPVLAYGVEKDLEGRLDSATVILRGQRSAGINSTVEFYGKD
ncbi:uncharacterized protein LOC119603344 [Lucilia sericata]|uniref:uncharacterized protein LOC119603344 n=1 Tax=Lucilia sericata TaxID=13632 RepID=UPI0018A82A3A|nr:uncharacterized protein LOC119603344 [Lucilia sericata]